MGPPASYPDFKGLIEEVAAGSRLTRVSPEEPDDRYLGRLERKGVQVHRRVKQLLTNADSRPNPLHECIVRLFVRDKPVRIVTTNFDSHFTTAIKLQLPKDQVEIYGAPALPVGSKFEGLVYLHGSVDGPEDRLVLTDSDFGRAYLTEGWARRFLQDLYNT